MKFTPLPETFKDRPITVCLNNETEIKITTPDGDVEFNRIESIKILQYLMEQGMLTPLVMIDLLGGEQFFRDLAEKGTKYGDAYADLEEAVKTKTINVD